MPTLWKILALLMLMLASNSSWCQRDTLMLSGQWSFAVDSVREGIVESWFSAGFSRAAAHAVTVPHTWNTMQGLETYAGIGWYERTFSVPASWKGKVIFLQFSAVYHDATIWINGQKAGEHNGAGYTPFCLDVTRLVRIGPANAIRVAVDNSYSTHSIPYERSFDWPNDGGMIRPVSLVAVPSSGIDELHVSGSPRFSAGGTQGTVNLSFGLHWLKGNGDLHFAYQITVRNDSPPESSVVFKKTFPVVTVQRPCRHSLTVPEVSPWNIDAPHLYSLEVRLLNDGVLVDRVESSFGFREIRTEGSHIYLNGQPVRLMGVEWMPGSSIANGMAESREEMIGMLKKLRGVNAVFTRFHWQQDETVFDWCDRHGILVQEEVPLWGGKTPLNDTILALAKMHLDEMIGAHYNHPSIIMWGVGNELASDRPEVVQGVRQLCRYARSIDSSRLVNYVSNKAAFSGGRDAIGEGDVLMFNEYQDTWYQGDPARVGGMLDTIHLEYPGRPLVISEYGLCEPAFQGGDERRINDMIYHTAIYESKAYVAGAIYFCLNDYRTHVGEAGEGVLRRRVHGVYDLQGNAKRSAQILRRMSSPIKVINVPWKGRHLIELKLVGGSGLPSYLCSGYTLIWSSPGQDYRDGQRLPLPDFRANESRNVFLEKFAGDTVVATLVRPSGDVVDTWEFAAEHQQ